MASTVRPHALLRALYELGAQGVLLGGKHPPPPAPSWSGKSPVIRHQAQRARAKARVTPILSTPSRASQSATSSSHSSAVANESWTALRAIVRDAFGIVFRGVRREGSVPRQAAQQMRHLSREYGSTAVKRQHAFYQSRTNQSASGSQHPFYAPRLSIQVTQPIHGNGLQAARKFSSQGTSGLLFHVPLAVRALATDVEEKTKRKKLRPCKSNVTQKPLRAPRYPRRAGRQSTIPFKRLVLPPFESVKPIPESKITSVTAPTESIHADSATSSTIDEDEFDRYFASLDAHASIDEVADVVSVLCVPLDPAMATVYREAYTSGHVWHDVSSNRPDSSLKRLVDTGFIKQVEQIHAQYEFHALKYIVPLERALDTAAWRRYLPRDWDMNLLITSAIEGVQRGHHCLEIRFTGTPAAIVRRLLYETMSESDAQWYCIFLHEEREVQDDAVLVVDSSSTSSTASSVTLRSAPSAAMISDSPHSGSGSGSGFDMALEIADMGAASRLSFEELGHGDAASSHFDCGSISSAPSGDDTFSLQFPTLAIAQHRGAGEHDFAEAFLSRYSDTHHC